MVSLLKGKVGGIKKSYILIGGGLAAAGVGLYFANQRGWINLPGKKEVADVPMAEEFTISAPSVTAGIPETVTSNSTNQTFFSVVRNEDGKTLQTGALQANGTVTIPTGGYRAGGYSVLISDTPFNAPTGGAGMPNPEVDLNRFAPSRTTINDQVGGAAYSPGNLAITSWANVV